MRPLLLLLCASACVGFDVYWDYGVMLDAGSTGTRVFVYRWPHDHTGQRILIEPETNANWSMAVRPGLNAFATRPSDAGTSVKVLLDFARATILGNDVEQSRLGAFSCWVKATAGMRLLGFLERDQILTSVRAQVAVSGFFFDPDNIRVISGEEEGVYGWISVNYLRGTLLDALDAPGVLDLGGSSAQITFIPAEHHDIIAGYFPLRFKGTNLRVYTHSFLQFGHETALYRMTAMLNKEQRIIDHPCLPRRSYWNGTMLHSDLSLEFRGTGDYDECLTLSLRLLDKNIPCMYSSCSFAGVYQPRLLTRSFVGIGHFASIVQRDLNISRDSSVAEIRQAARAMCGMEYDALRARLPLRKKFDLSRVCSNAVWAIALLHYGYGFPDDARQIVFERPAIGMLGAMLYEANILPWAQKSYSLHVTDPDNHYFQNFASNVILPIVPAESSGSFGAFGLLLSVGALSVLGVWRWRNRRSPYVSI